MPELRIEKQRRARAVVVVRREQNEHIDARVGITSV